jgi:hypothetical protein
MNSVKSLESRLSPGRFHDTVACPACGVYQSVEIDYEDGQGCATVTLTPCRVCHQKLCCFCDQLRCECGQIVCPNCVVTVPDGTPPGLKLCKPCASQSDPLCPACGEFARMLPRQNMDQQWFECSDCGAAVDEDEITAAQMLPRACRQTGTAAVGEEPVAEAPSVLARAGQAALLAEAGCTPEEIAALLSGKSIGRQQGVLFPEVA